MASLSDSPWRLIAFRSLDCQIFWRACVGDVDGKLSVLQHCEGKSLFLDVQDTTDLLQIIIVASVNYVLCLGLAKFSILFLYRKLSQLRWFNLCVYTLMAIVISYSVGIIFALIFPCQPVSANWDLSVTDFKCIDKAGIYLATAAANVITDVLILALPIPMILRLHMPKAQKIAVCLVFAVGST